MNDELMKGITDDKLYGKKPMSYKFCGRTMSELAHGAEVMGNADTLLFSDDGKVTKLYFNTPASGYPKPLSEEFPGLGGTRHHMASYKIVQWLTIVLTIVLPG